MNKMESLFLHTVGSLSEGMEKSGLYKILRKRSKKEVIMLMYHGITAKKDAVTNFDNKHVYIEKFEKQLAYVKENYNLISFEDFILWHKGEKEIPDNAIILTFDDGYKNTYTNLFPLLQKYNAPAIIFLPTAYIGKKEIAWYDIVAYAIANTKEHKITIGGKDYVLDSDKTKKAVSAEIKAKIRVPKKRAEIITGLIKETKCNLATVADEDVLFLSWKECAEMAKKSVTFGAHGVAHESFLVLSEQEKRREVEDSKQEIEKKGYSVTSFAYPFGAGDDDTLLKEAGYSAGLTTEYGRNTRKTNIMRLHRICVTDMYDLPIFVLNIFVRFPSFHYLLVKTYARLRLMIKL